MFTALSSKKGRSSLHITEEAARPSLVDHPTDDRSDETDEEEIVEVCLAEGSAIRLGTDMSADNEPLKKDYIRLLLSNKKHMRLTGISQR